MAAYSMVVRIIFLPLLYSFQFTCLSTSYSCLCSYLCTLFLTYISIILYDPLIKVQIIWITHIIICLSSSRDISRLIYNNRLEYIIYKILNCTGHGECGRLLILNQVYFFFCSQLARKINNLIRL